MIATRIRGYAYLKGIMEAVMAYCLFWALFYVLQAVTRWTPAQLPTYHLFSCVASLAVAAIGILFERDSQKKIGYLPSGMLKTASAGLAIFFFLWILHDEVISRFFVLLYLLGLGIGLVLTDRFLSRAVAKMVFSGNPCRVAVLATNPEDRQNLIVWVETQSHYGLRLAKCLTAEDVTNPPNCSSVYRSKLEYLMARGRIHMLVAADAHLLSGGVETLRALCDNHGVRLSLYLPAFMGSRSPMSLYADEGVQLMNFRPEPLESPLSGLAKRVLDLSIAIPVLIFILPPLSLFVWTMQVFQSQGPLLYSQIRIGRGRSRIKVFKFRTMHVGDFDVAKQATSTDARVYPFGRFLRRTSLDEIPQFLNVLRGEMSTVGPRPHLPEHEDHFATIANDHRVRNLVKPGITGLAQMKGLRGEIVEKSELRKRTEADIIYMERWSIGLDIWIIFRTALQILRPPKKAY